MTKKHIDLVEEPANEHLETTESSAAEDFNQFLAVSEAGRKYKTTFTKKFENRPKWVSPNPEEIKSFIPGTVEKIMVKKGQEVKEGDELMIYVAMKMRNIIRAPFDGKVDAILVKENDRLPKGSIMLVVKEKQVSAKEKKRLEKEIEKKEKEYEKKIERKVTKKKKRRYIKF